MNKSTYSSTPSKWFLIQNPIIYQGWNKTKNYFEGWYFKTVDRENNLAFSFIPGISRDTNGKSHAFIQFIDGINQNTEYHTFDIKDFKSDNKSFSIQIKDNTFSLRSLTINLDHIQAKLKIEKPQLLKPTLLRPGIMGWYAYMPFMQCYHGLVSMNHQVSGHINMNGHEYQLDRSDGYIEKDWGSSFPKAWIWNQCNSFSKEDDLSIFASVAHIPWLGSHFIGFIAAFYWKGKIEVFATYNQSKNQTSLHQDSVEMIFTKGKKRIEIIATKAEGADLISPISGEMRGKVNESLLAKVELSYFENGKRLLEDVGFFAGLELGGDVDELV
jgi:hypothetical protein